MYFFPFLCILLNSVAAIDFDSEYSTRCRRLRTEITRISATKLAFSSIVYASLFFSLIHLYFQAELFSPLPAGPSEVFAIVGTNESLACQANEQLIWWSKDGKNITKTDKRQVSLPHTTDDTQNFPMINNLFSLEGSHGTRRRTSRSRARTS